MGTDSWVYNPRMPELPEVETVRRSLLPLLPTRIERVTVQRPEVVVGRATARALLAGADLVAISRQGKQLAFCTADGGRCCAVHLGMTGSLRHVPPGCRTHPTDHCHVTWHLPGGHRLIFRDPRRFGGLWTFPSMDALQHERWSPLGPDALEVTPRVLAARLARTRRPLKAALLDQTLIAGLGNIYVDELLFACSLAPDRPAATLAMTDVQGLVRRMRTLLSRAIRAGGSSLRDYVDGRGDPGRFQFRHQVYGRAALPCRACGAQLASRVLAGRTTVSCLACQR